MAEVRVAVAMAVGTEEVAVAVVGMVVEGWVVAGTPARAPPSPPSASAALAAPG